MKASFLDENIILEGEKITLPVPQPHAFPFFARAAMASIYSLSREVLMECLHYLSLPGLVAMLATSKVPFSLPIATLLLLYYYYCMNLHIKW